MNTTKVAVLTMQKDEGDLVRTWFDYYSSRFGAEGIYLIDNGSSDAESIAGLDYVKSQGGSVEIIPGKAAFENKGELLLARARALFQKGFEWAYFADADEFLVLDQDGKLTSDAMAIDEEFQRLALLASSGVCRIDVGFFNIPGSTLAYRDIYGSKKVVVGRNASCELKLDLGFHLYDWGRRCDITTWGELVLSRFAFVHFHNKPHDLFVAAARRKLVGRVEDFSESTLRAYRGPGIHLIENLLKSEQEYCASFEARKPGAVDISAVLQDCGLRVPYANYVPSWAAVAGRERAPGELLSAQELLAEGLHLRSSGNFDGASKIFRLGIQTYPDETDTYGDPVFRKELVRTLLQIPAWDLALQEVQGSEANWIDVLFARAYAASGDLAQAAQRWRRVLERYSDHEEAKRWLGEHPEVGDTRRP